MTISLTQSIAWFCESISPLIQERLDKYWPIFRWELSYSASGWDFIFYAKATIDINGKPVSVKTSKADDLCKKDINFELLIDTIAVFLGARAFDVVKSQIVPPATADYVDDITDRFLRAVAIEK